MSAIELVKEFEGLRLRVYEDSAGKRTIGFGHLLKSGEHFRQITRPQADALLQADMQFAVEAVNKYVKVPLTENQRNSLISFVFNCGAGAFARSTLLKLLNRREYVLAAAQLMRFVNAGGRRTQGLVNRREREMKLFLTPDE